jgi:SAM-dependent methyltransferase
LPSFPGLELLDIGSRPDWEKLGSESFMRLRTQFEKAAIEQPRPAIANAYCASCNQIQPMPVNDRYKKVFPDGRIAFAFSEMMACPLCKLNSRMRFAIEILRTHSEDRTGLRLYLTEKKTNLFASLEKLGFDCRGSEWLGPDKTPGETYDGVEHQDIHQLTYRDETFDVVLSLDVLEHVNDPETAAGELYRVLKPAGLALITFPFFPQRDATVVRSRIEAGEIKHLKPAHYHGNPLGGGSLVFSEFSWDFIARLKERYGDRARFVNYWSVYSAHFGRERFALLLSK